MLAAALVFGALLLLPSCAGHPDVPSSSKDAGCLPAIFPDYCDVTVPCNIAFLHARWPAADLWQRREGADARVGMARHA